LIQAKNGTTSEAGREAILNDVQKLLTQLDAIATQTNYNGINLLQNSSDASNAANGEEKFTMTDIGSAGNGTVTWAASGAAGASGTISVSVADDATAEEVSAAMVAAINSDATASEYYVAKDNEDGSFSVTSVSFAADFDSAVGGTASGTAGTGTNLGAETQVATATAESGGATTSQAVTFQIGESSGNTVATTGIQANTIGLDLGTLKTMDSGYFTADTAGTMMAVVDSAIDSLNSNRSNFGSVQNQLESAIRNMQTTYTNIKAAESTIRDVDYAQESANFNKQNIIAQAGTYALSQANAIQQNVLKLLQ
jgi:flagellin